MAKNGYSGLNEDTPGPSGYDPNTDIIKAKSTCYSQFSRSRTTREVFSHTKELIPGPTSYEARKLDKRNPNSKSINNNLLEKGHTSTFLSRVPNCKDLPPDKLDKPGPGTYDLLH